MTDDLSLFKAGLKSESVIGVTDLMGAWHSSGTHPSPSDTLTRLTLHTQAIVIVLALLGGFWSDQNLLTVDC